MSIKTNNLKVPKMPELGGGEWELNNLTDVTVVFGRNGSGKSVLLRAIRDKNPTNYHYITPIALVIKS